MNSSRDLSWPLSVCVAAGRIVVGLLRLFKWRVVMLLLLAAVTGAFLGAGGWPGSEAVVVLLLAGGLAAAGASVVNEYLEFDMDRVMQRTRRRPLVTGAIARSHWVLALGVALIVLPVLAVLPCNPALGLWVVLGAIVYVGVYTVWLKSRTPLNVVVGGLAGSCAVLSGGAAVHAWAHPAVIGLGLLLFLWSPTHFWSLALACRGDYARANVPMLPVVTTPRRAAQWNLLHAAGSVIIGLLLAVRPELGLWYLAPVAIASLYLLARGLRLVEQSSARRAWQMFHAANLYLGVVLLAICLTTYFHV